MKLFFVTLMFPALLALCGCGIRSASTDAPVAPRQTKVELAPSDYGSMTDSTITVSLVGDGITHAGVYHIQPKTELLELLQRGVPSRLFNGRLFVTRTENGEKRTLMFLLKSKESRPLPSFELKEGDFVYAGINLP